MGSKPQKECGAICNKGSLLEKTIDDDTQESKLGLGSSLLGMDYMSIAQTGDDVKVRKVAAI